MKISLKSTSCALPTFLKHVSSLGFILWYKLGFPYHLAKHHQTSGQEMFDLLQQLSRTSFWTRGDASCSLTIHVFTKPKRAEVPHDQSGEEVVFFLILQSPRQSDGITWRQFRSYLPKPGGMSSPHLQLTHAPEGQPWDARCLL